MAEFILVDIEDVDVVAFLEEAANQSSADAASASGDDCSLVLRHVCRLDLCVLEQFDAFVVKVFKGDVYMCTSLLLRLHSTSDIDCRGAVHVKLNT